MRSRVDRRSLLERALRIVAVSATALLIVRALASGSATAPAVVDSAGLDTALAQWTRVAPATVRVRADVPPPAAARDWLVALRRAGTAVSWTLRDTAAAALVAEPVAAPGGGSRLVVVGSPGRSAVVADRAGAIDSVVIGDAGAIALRRSIAGAVTARIGAASATSARRDSLRLRPVLVVGAAGWESKFTIAALEEDGWEVHVRLAVAPGATVRQGGAAPIDTASLSAVVVLDSAAAASANALRRFVQQGGGLVLAGNAVTARSLAALAPARAAGRLPGVPGALTGPSPRTGLTVWTLDPTSPRAVPLERRGAAPVVVAHRVGAGRVIAAGFEDTWRWRMLGADEAVAAHRAWWTSLVASVAHAPVVADPNALSLDEAPLAATVAALGPPSNDPGTVGRRRWPLNALLFGLLLAALLGEWWSRRLRGLP